RQGQGQTDGGRGRRDPAGRGRRVLDQGGQRRQCHLRQHEGDRRELDQAHGWRLGGRDRRQRCDHEGLQDRDRGGQRGRPQGFQREGELRRIVTPSTELQYKLLMKGFEDEDLRVLRYTGVEGVSTLFEFEIEIAVEGLDLEFEEQVGEDAQFTWVT